MASKILNIKDFDGLNDILFNRPINSLYKKNIVLYIPKTTKLKVVNDFYQIINILGHNPILISEKNDNLSKLEVNLFLDQPKNNKLIFEPADEYLELSFQSSCNIIGLDNELSSRWQLLYEKLLSSNASRIIFTNKTYKLFDERYKAKFSTRKGDIMCFDFEQFSKIAKISRLIKNTKNVYSVENKIDILRMISGYFNINCICIDPKQVIVVAEDESSKALVANISSENPEAFEYQYLTVALCLLAESNFDSSKFIELCAASAKLYRNSLNNNKFSLDRLKLSL